MSDTQQSLVAYQLAFMELASPDVTTGQAKGACAAYQISSLRGRTEDAAMTSASSQAMDGDYG